MLSKAKENGVFCLRYWYTSDFSDITNTSKYLLNKTYGDDKVAFSEYLKALREALEKIKK